LRLVDPDGEVDFDVVEAATEVTAALGNNARELYQMSGVGMGQGIITRLSTGDDKVGAAVGVFNDFMSPDVKAAAAFAGSLASGNNAAGASTEAADAFVNSLPFASVAKDLEQVEQAAGRGEHEKSLGHMVRGMFHFGLDVISVTASIAGAKGPARKAGPNPAARGKTIEPQGVVASLEGPTKQVIPKPATPSKASAPQTTPKAGESGLQQDGIDPWLDENAAQWSDSVKRDTRGSTVQQHLYVIYDVAGDVYKWGTTFE
jgi:hypothetical protein